MEHYHPHFLWVYLADVDHAGHTGDWINYTSTLQNADRLVKELWDYLQADPFYQNATTMIVTNDHGRHDDQHGGFQNHGCGCEGCRHIQFLAVGPHIKKGFVSTTYRTTPDMAVTAAYLTGVNPAKATGHVINEIITFSGIDPVNPVQAGTLSVVPNPVGNLSEIRFHLLTPATVWFELSDATGKMPEISEPVTLPGGMQRLKWSDLGFNLSGRSDGIYFLTLKSRSGTETQKIVIGKQ